MDIFLSFAPKKKRKEGCEEKSKKAQEVAQKLFPIPAKKTRTQTKTKKAATRTEMFLAGLRLKPSSELFKTSGH